METNTPGIQRKQRSGGDRLTGNNFGKDEGLGGTHLCLPSTWHVLVELNWASESGCPGEHYGLMWPEAGQKGILEQAGKKKVPGVDRSTWTSWGSVLVAVPSIGKTMSHPQAPDTSQTLSPQLTLKRTPWGTCHPNSNLPSDIW